ncbi:hypothetical protein BGZ49_007168 [Haplosporangium sp. Z 27]|nr:hypothetical protein BGZ49_007168 [Haplosporangium sp. Z 27]
MKISALFSIAALIAVVAASANPVQEEAAALLPVFNGLQPHAGSILSRRDDTFEAEADIQLEKRALGTKTLIYQMEKNGMFALKRLVFAPTTRSVAVPLEVDAVPSVAAAIKAITVTDQDAALTPNTDATERVAVHQTGTAAKEVHAANLAPTAFVQRAERLDAVQMASFATTKG